MEAAEDKCNNLIRECKNVSVELLKDKSGLTKKDIESVLAALTDSVRECVLDGGKEIRLRDFGTFKPKVTKARMGRNPRTGEAIPVSGSTSYCPCSPMGIASYRIRSSKTKLEVQSIEFSSLVDFFHFVTNISL